MAGSRPASVVELDGREALRLPCNFRGTRIERASWDRQVKLDLTAARGVQFLFCCPDTSPVSSFTLYLRSGAGWYRGAFHPGPADRWTLIRIAKSQMEAEDRPAGWGRIDALRLSAWRGADADTEFLIADLGLYGGGGRIIIVRGEAAARASPDEARAIRQYAEITDRFLEGAGLACSILSDEDLTADRLKSGPDAKARKLIILPYNPSMPDAAAGQIAAFVKDGGKLLSFYWLPDSLAAPAGLRLGRHIREARRGQFASIRPSDRPLAGAPPDVRQASWNIRQAEPLDGRGRIAAWWHDDAGQSTGQAAVVVTDTAVHMTHVLLADDPAAKQMLLLAMAGELVPDLWAEAAEGRFDRIGRFGPYDGCQAALRGVRQAAAASAAGSPLGPGAALEALAKAEKLIEQAGALREQRRCPQAVAAAEAAHRALLEAHCLVQKPLGGEHRAVWCHSAFGVASMDWDQAAKLLADSGFTAVLPNMLWAGAAFYPSDVLPAAAEVSQRGDQIAQCLAACKKHGLACHVWKVNYNMGSSAPKGFADRMRQLGRMQVRPDGGPIDRWLCPSHPDNQKLEIDSMLEVARKYDVAGLHFDYIRYPGSEGCFCPGCRQRFQKAVGRPVARWPADVRDGGELRDAWLDFRRRQITTVVAAVAEQARKVRPGLKISAAVFGNWPTDRDSVGQDWKLWCQRGYLDFVCPMDYTPHAGQFAQMVARQRTWAGAVPCYPGIGVSTWADPTDVAEVIQQITAARQAGCAGFTLFNYDPALARDVLPLLAKGITRREASK